MSSYYADLEDAYSLLGVQLGDSLERVKSAYKQRALRIHPDKNRHDPEAAAQFTRLKEAFDTIESHLRESDSEEYYSDTDILAEAFASFYYEMMMEQKYDAARRAWEQERLQRQREQAAQEAARRKERVKEEAERERVSQAERQKAKAENKKAQAESERRRAEERGKQMKAAAQRKRSTAFACARAGMFDEVKKAVYEDGVDGAGGEVLPNGEEFSSHPLDPLETLLHIASHVGDKTLVEWLIDHGADPEERNSQGLSSVHVALQNGHAKVVSYFFESYPPKDADFHAMYATPEPYTVLSLALSAYESQLIGMILDNQLATSEASASAGRKIDEIMRILKSQGEFTPSRKVASDEPRVPSEPYTACDKHGVHGGGGKQRQPPPRRDASHDPRSASGNSKKEPVEGYDWNRSCGRGRGRGAGTAKAR